MYVFATWKQSSYFIFIILLDNFFLIIQNSNSYESILSIIVSQLDVSKLATK